LVEPLSIDEAFLDVTGSMKLFGSPVDIGKLIKKRIVESQGITASVGIASIKYLSKIASDLRKPDGLVFVDPEKIDEFLAPLEISRLWGAGRKTIEKLESAGIHTFGDLAKFPEETLKDKYGKVGIHFYKLAHGLDERDVVPLQGVKSVSNEITYWEDVSDLEIIYQTLLRLSEKVGYRMRKKSLTGKTIHLKLRYEGFETIIRNKTIENYTANTEEICGIIKKLFDLNYISGKKVRLLGVGVNNLGTDSGRQLSLFEKQIEESESLDKLEDLIKKKFGKKSILRAQALLKNKIKKEN